MLTQSENEELGLTQEQEECHACGIDYLTFPIEDRAIPENVREWKQFIEQVSVYLKDGKTAAIHCRAGIGRSSLLACSVLAHLGVNYNEAWSSIRLARGCNVPDTLEQRNFVKRLMDLD
ncbi:MAG TPA: dual specificity protein phosphatase family protein [Verrucomicrobiae bacterium]|nr:dual specificity protein phosphatase family protein [Verrucomicrobiae bacterium]